MFPVFDHSNLTQIPGIEPGSDTNLLAMFLTNLTEQHSVITQIQSSTENERGVERGVLFSFFQTDFSH